MVMDKLSIMRVITYPLLIIRIIIIRALSSVLMRVLVGYLTYYYYYYYHDYYYNYYRYSYRGSLLLLLTRGY